MTVTTDRAHDQVTIVVSCDVEFTDFEVNTMNMLGVRYSLRCSLLDMDMLYAEADVHFAEQEFPRRPAATVKHEHAEFQVVATMHHLHRFIFGKDTLVGELVLRNEQTGVATVKRTEVVQVNLAA